MPKRVIQVPLDEELLAGVDRLSRSKVEVKAPVNVLEEENW